MGTGEFLDETSPTNPQTAYAQCKVLVERDLAPMADDGFCVVFLRNATAYGASPRMRFDIVLNDLCALAWTTKKIAMVSDGSPWRPIVHVEDICEAMRCAAEAPADAVNGEIFNVGDTRENYRVREIAQIVAEAFPGCEVSAGPPSQDNRSYRVSFDKIASRAAGLQGALDARTRAPRSCARCSSASSSRSETYEFRAFTRLKQLKYLQRTRQIDEDLFWSRGDLRARHRSPGRSSSAHRAREDERGFFARVWCRESSHAPASRSRWCRPASRTTARPARCAACTSHGRRPVEGKLVRCSRGRDPRRDRRPAPRIRPPS